MAYCSLLRINRFKIIKGEIKLQNSVIDSISDKRWLNEKAAIEYSDGDKYWYIEGKQYTEEEYNKKVSEMKIQTPEIDKDGNKVWKNEKGQYHRLDEPAMNCINGNKLWYQNGRLHRLDGPAIEYADGDKYWYIDGKEYTKSEFNNIKIIDGKVYLQICDV